MSPLIRLLAAGAALVGLLSTGCASMTPPADLPTLDGTAWVLSALPGRTLLPGTTATLRFEDDRASGSDGCNRFNAAYSSSGAALKIDPAGAMTQMACPPEVMEQAQAFMSGLQRATGFRIDAGQLQLTGDDGTLLASFAPQSQQLAGTSWNVTGYNNGKQAVVSVLLGTHLTMAFADDGRVSGSTGCNSFTGSYTAAGSSLQFDALAATRRMCADASVMDQEQRFLAALASVTTIRQEGGRAELRTATGALAVSLAQDDGK